MRRALALSVLGAAALTSCGEPKRAEAALSPWEQMVRDSASADSAAFASLPNGVDTLLDLRPVLRTQVLDALPLAECVVFSRVEQGETRRRLRLRLPDSSAVVLYAAADRATGALNRVEFVRRTPKAGQRGLVWDVRRDITTSLWWPEFETGIQRRAERGDIPRGSPLPRAVRALGRQLLTLPCATSAPDSADRTLR